MMPLHYMRACSPNGKTTCQPIGRETCKTHQHAAWQGKPVPNNWMQDIGIRRVCVTLPGTSAVADPTIASFSADRLPRNESLRALTSRQIAMGHHPFNYSSTVSTFVTTLGGGVSAHSKVAFLGILCGVAFSPYPIPEILLQSFCNHCVIVCIIS